MLLRATRFILGAAALFGLAQAQNTDPACGTGPWNPGNIQWVGGTGGTGFCATKHGQGIIISGVEVWSSASEVQAIQFYYSDGTNSPQFGKVRSDHAHARLQWDPSVETLSQVKLWGNGKAEFLGRVFIRTSAGQELNVGRDTNGQNTFEANVESGILVGAFGAAGDNIYNLAFLFLRSKIDRIAVTDVTFKDTPEELNKRKQGIQAMTLDLADHTNNLKDTNETYTFGKTETRTTSKKYSSTLTHTFGVKVGIKIEGNLLVFKADYSTELSYQYSDARTVESTTENSIGLQYLVATTLKPGQHVYCRATAQYGQYDGEYTSNVNVYLDDGTVYRFAQEGSYSEIAWSQASSSCQSQPFSAGSPPLAPPAKQRIGTKFLA